MRKLVSADEIFVFLFLLLPYFLEGTRNIQRAEKNNCRKHRTVRNFLKNRKKNANLVL